MTKKIMAVKTHAEKTELGERVKAITLKETGLNYNSVIELMSSNPELAKILEYKDEVWVDNGKGTQILNSTALRNKGLIDKMPLNLINQLNKKIENAEDPLLQALQRREVFFLLLSSGYDLTIEFEKSQNPLLSIIDSGKIELFYQMISVMQYREGAIEGSYKKEGGTAGERETVLEKCIRHTSEAFLEEAFSYQEFRQLAYTGGTIHKNYVAIALETKDMRKVQIVLKAIIHEEGEEGVRNLFLERKNERKALEIFKQCINLPLSQCIEISKYLCGISSKILLKKFSTEKEEKVAGATATTVRFSVEVNMLQYLLFIKDQEEVFIELFDQLNPEEKIVFLNSKISCGAEGERSSLEQLLNMQVAKRMRRALLSVIEGVRKLEYKKTKALLETEFRIIGAQSGAIRYTLTGNALLVSVQLRDNEMIDALMEVYKKGGVSYASMTYLCLSKRYGILDGIIYFSVDADVFKRVLDKRIIPIVREEIEEELKAYYKEVKVGERKSEKSVYILKAHGSASGDQSIVAYTVESGIAADKSYYPASAKIVMMLVEEIKAGLEKIPHTKENVESALRIILERESISGQSTLTKIQQEPIYGEVRKKYFEMHY